MLRIRKVQDDTTPANVAVIHEAQSIMRRQFPGISSADIDKLPDQLRDPISFGFVSRLFVAEDAHDKLHGLALLLLFSDIGVAYLELISAAPGGSGRGIGDVLYSRVQEEAVALGAGALFFECLPDDPALSPDPEIRAQNEARLKFYERFGARPIAGTAYETPLDNDSTDPPYLVVDMLGGTGAPDRDLVRKTARAILERKYENVCGPEYVKMVIDSINADPVQLRDFKYVKPRQRRARDAGLAQIPVVINDQN